MKYLLDLIYLLVGILISPIVIGRMFSRQRRYRAGWKNRFGWIDRKISGKKSIWVHAVSVGEVNATRTIVPLLIEKFPSYEIAVSTTTDTGQMRAKALYGANPKISVFYFPFDLSLSMSRAFKNIDPEICLLMELEVWPNFMTTAQKHGAAVIVINGRLSDNSFRQYLRIRPIAKWIFSKITLVLSQSDQYSERFRELGCENVITAGSLKYDTAQTEIPVPGADEVASKLNLQTKKLLVAGGTGNNEETVILNSFNKLRNDGFKDIFLVIVPRKPERFELVAQEIISLGFDCLKFSDYKDSDKSAGDYDSNTVILGDTMGDLRKFYSVAYLILVGRSLVPMGGSDMIEAAALGKCTIFGKHTFNFRQAVDALLASNGALQVSSEAELNETLKKCILEPEFAKKIAKSGRNTIIENQGATKRIIEQISRFLD